MPKTTEFETQLQSRIDAFVDEISALVREAAMDAVSAAFQADGAAPRAKAVGRPAKPGGRRKATARKSKTGGRIRRTTADLEEIGTQFLAHVKANPGQRLEQIAVALGLDTAVLKRPVKLLLDAKKIKTKGQRRGTMYFAGGRGGAKAVTRKKPTARKRKSTRRTK